MNKIPLTLLAVASLTIAAITAQADSIERAEMQTVVDNHGNKQVTLGPPIVVTGAWEACPILRFTTSTSVGAYFDAEAADVKQKLIALMTPVVAETPGYATFGAGVNVAVGKKGKPNGNAYGTGVTSQYTNDTDDQPDQSAYSLALARAEYKANIKSGKWATFQNGE